MDGVFQDSEADARSRRGDWNVVASGYARSQRRRRDSLRCLQRHAAASSKHLHSLTLDFIEVLEFAFIY